MTPQHRISPAGRHRAQPSPTVRGRSDRLDGDGDHPSNHAAVEPASFATVEYFAQILKLDLAARDPAIEDRRPPRALG